MLVKMFHGFCMALADSVPGVSGGTVAFILGFYEKFIDALHGLFGKDNGARKVAVLYLAKLGVGWCLGLCLSVVALNDLFQTKTYFLSSLFLGLTAAAFPFILRTEWWALKGKGRYLPYTLLGVALVCGLCIGLLLGSCGGGTSVAGVGSGPTRKTSMPAASSPAASAFSKTYPESRVSLPMTTFAGSLSPPRRLHSPQYQPKKRPT